MVGKRGNVDYYIEYYQVSLGEELMVNRFRVGDFIS